MITIIFVLISFFLVLMIAWRYSSRRFSLPCPTWLGWMVEMDNPFAKISRAATIVENLDLQEGMMVLDVGCGPGRVTIPVSNKIGSNGEVTAMDIQAGMLQKIQEKAQIANLTNIKFLHAAAGENKLESNKFDRILMVSVLGEIPNREAALQEIFGALKPNGIFSVTEIIFDPHFQRRATIIRLALAAGFREKKLLGNAIAFTLNFEKPSSDSIA